MIRFLRFFSKNLKVLRQTAEFYQRDEDGIGRVIPAETLPETIEVKITIDRYKNTINFDKSERIYFILI